MTRYITMLLVALAATGLEAQTYSAALKAVLADPEARQVMMQRTELAQLRDDLMSAVKLLARAQRHAPNNYPSTVSVATAGMQPALQTMPTLPTTVVDLAAEPRSTLTEHAIEIRAPSRGHII